MVPGRQVAVTAASVGLKLCCMVLPLTAQAAAAEPVLPLLPGVCYKTQSTAPRTSGLLLPLVLLGLLLVWC